MGKSKLSYAICCEIKRDKLYKKIAPCNHINHTNPPSKFCPECGIRTGLVDEPIDEYEEGYALYLNNQEYSIHHVEKDYYIIFEEESIEDYELPELEIEDKHIQELEKLNRKYNLELDSNDLQHRLMYDGWNSI